MAEPTKSWEHLYERHAFQNPTKATARMNELGAQGRELVTAVWLNGNWELFFKRPAA